MTIRISTVALVAGLVLGNFRPGAAKSRLAIEQAPKVEGVADSHGLVPPLEADLRPEAIVVGPGKGESLEAGLVVTNNRDVDLRLVTAVEILRDDGAVVSPAAAQPIQRVMAKRAEGSLVVTPEGLNDGYYQLRTRTAAIWSDGMEGGTSGGAFFKVEGGAVLPMDLESWYLEAKIVGVEPQALESDGGLP